MNRTKRLTALLATALAVTLVAAACGDDDDDDTAATTAAPSETTAAPSETTAAPSETTAAPSETTAGGGGGLSGAVKITGSSTVEPISAAVAELFSKANPNVAISVEGPGTGDGFEKFCNGEADISDASRPIKAAEVEKCQGKGIEFIELKVAIDGLSVLTSQKNEAVKCLAFTDLYALVGPESTGFGKWSDADDLAAEIGAAEYAEGASNGPFPDATLAVYGPGEESGTYDSFVELAIAGIAKAREQDDVTRPDYTASPTDNVIIEGIANNDTSLGWVGFAFAEENKDKVKELEVDGGDGCIAPTPETIANGEYPLSRALYIYVDKAKAEANAAIPAYVDLYLDSLTADGVIGTGEGQVPYVNLTDEDIAATQKVWEARETGTRDGGK